LLAPPTERSIFFSSFPRSRVGMHRFSLSHALRGMHKEVKKWAEADTKLSNRKTAFCYFNGIALDSDMHASSYRRNIARFHPIFSKIWDHKSCLGRFRKLLPFCTAKQRTG